ncbi:MAG: YdeI/OmpD-associated family protein [Flavobacteriaceae bacterium]
MQWRSKKKGLEVTYKKTEEFNIPEELTQVLKEDKEFKKAFEALTPGRQRGYYLHFAAPKQSATRLARIERCKLQIYKGKGHNER